MTARRRRTLARVITASTAAIIAACLAVGVGQSASALAQASGETGVETDLITWGVVPADAAGPDGRRVVNLSLEPGDSVTEHIAVTNHSATEITFRVSANDGILTAKGSFDMLPSGTEPSDGGSWITVQENVTIPAGDTAVVPVGVAVPETATPGDHPAGVAASVISGATVSVESRVGVRFNIAVDGAFDTTLAATVTDVHYEPALSPFQPGAATVVYRVQNDGNVAMKVAGAAQASGIFGLGTTALVTGEQRELLPGASVEQAVRIDGVWPLFVADLDVTVTPTLRDALEVATPDAQSLSASTAALPLPQLVLLILAALVVFGAVAIRRQRRARLEAMLERARAEGAAQERASQAHTSQA